MAKRYRKGPVPTLTLEQRCYLAGLLDGEGAFTVNVSQSRSGQTYQARIRLAMSHKSTIEWVANVLGVTVLKHGLGRNVSANAKPMYRVAVEHVVGVVSLLEQIGPYLIAKREVADALLAFCRSRLESGYFKQGSRSRNGYVPEEMALYTRLKELNRFGVAHRKVG